MKKNDSITIRNTFPFLKRKFKGYSLAYLDNASTTQKPASVTGEITNVYNNHYANVHRGVYDLSQEATERYEDAREKTASFIGAKSSSEIIFTKNTTESLNLLAYTLGQTLKDGDEILLSEMEHHSNIVPWQIIRNRMLETGVRVKLKYIPIDKEGNLAMSSLAELATKKSKILSLTLMSNVLGTINDIGYIIEKSKKKSPSLVAVCDAAQAAAHYKIDVGKLGCDFLAFSSHKIYGPAGVGVLWGRESLLSSMNPFLGGGDMINHVDFENFSPADLPWKFEAGTPNIADVIAFGKAIDFIRGLGFLKINRIERELTNYALSKLGTDKTVNIYGGKDRGPVISFNVGGIHPHDVASILSGEGVAIRSGHHCAQPLMKVLGINSACRISFAVYNTKEEVDRFIAGLKKVKEVFKV